MQGEQRLLWGNKGAYSLWRVARGTECTRGILAFRRFRVYKGVQGFREYKGVQGVQRVQGRTGGSESTKGVQVDLCKG